MKYYIRIPALILFCLTTAYSQGFNVKASGEKTFSFNDKSNQAMFFSTTPLEDVTGISKEVNGTVTFNVTDLKTLKGKISISTA